MRIWFGLFPLHPDLYCGPKCKCSEKIFFHHFWKWIPMLPRNKIFLFMLNCLYILTNKQSIYVSTICFFSTEIRSCWVNYFLSFLILGCTRSNFGIFNVKELWGILSKPFSSRFVNVIFIFSNSFTTNYLQTILPFLLNCIEKAPIF